MGLFTAPPLETNCTIMIEHSADNLHAHVELDGDIALGPGDAVKVHGDPVRLPYGEALTLRRRVTVWKAGALRRWWTQLRAQTELTELYEITFSSEKPR
ncbi:hypothetical protein [Sandarakinorhabdus sp.]|uniref:hypothetical protein n=1 Tax=Sandarakinorhabdus sp. TaxID=1916663 RepID=UPI00286D8F4A|nr:hypothetical protein [Sandarakinorhabdus sp.]